MGAIRGGGLPLFRRRGTLDYAPFAMTTRRFIFAAAACKMGLMRSYNALANTWDQYEQVNRGDVIPSRQVERAVFRASAFGLITQTHPKMSRSTRRSKARELAKKTYRKHRNLDGLLTMRRSG